MLGSRQPNNWSPAFSGAREGLTAGARSRANRTEHGRHDQEAEDNILPDRYRDAVASQEENPEDRRERADRRDIGPEVSTEQDSKAKRLERRRRQRALSERRAHDERHRHVVDEVGPDRCPERHHEYGVEDRSLAERKQPGTEALSETEFLEPTHDDDHPGEESEK